MIARYATATALMAALLVLSILPGDPAAAESGFVWLVASVPSPLQNGLHVVAWAVLASVLWWAFAASRSEARRLGLAFGTSVAFGCVTEMLQAGIPGRYGTLSDLLLDVLGAVAGLALTRLLAGSIRMRRTRA